MIAVQRRSAIDLYWKSCMPEERKSLKVLAVFGLRGLEGII